MLRTWTAVNTSAPAPRNRCMSRTQAGRGRRPSSLVLRARPHSTAAAKRTQATRPLDRAAYHNSLLLMRSPLCQQPNRGRVGTRPHPAPRHPWEFGGEWRAGSGRPGRVARRLGAGPPGPPGPAARGPRTREAGRVPPPYDVHNLLRLLGIEIDEEDRDRLAGRFTVTHPLIAGTGYLWAPGVITLADALCALRAGPPCAAGAESFTTAAS